MMTEMERVNSGDGERHRTEQQEHRSIGNCKRWTGLVHGRVSMKWKRPRFMEVPDVEPVAPTDCQPRDDKEQQ